MKDRFEGMDAHAAAAGFTGPRHGGGNGKSHTPPRNTLKSLRTRILEAVSRVRPDHLPPIDTLGNGFYYRALIGRGCLRTWAGVMSDHHWPDSLRSESKRLSPQEPQSHPNPLWFVTIAFSMSETWCGTHRDGLTCPVSATVLALRSHNKNGFELGSSFQVPLSTTRRSSCCTDSARVMNSCPHPGPGAEAHRPRV